MELLIFCFSLLLAQACAKISLTFVFDTTGSMGDDLVGAINGAKKILETESAEMPDIENYIFSPFNDPTTGPVETFTDLQSFIYRLGNVTVGGGGDCPEMSMHGLLSGIQASLPGSLLFVFTDASAKDYVLGQQVKNAIQEKFVQIIYVLTGNCGNTTEPGYQIYVQTAELSGGQVFTVSKGDVSQVINYIQSHSAVPVVSYKSNNTATDLAFPVDANLDGGFTVTVSGIGASVSLVRPDGDVDNFGTNTINLPNVKAIRRTFNETLPPVYGKWKVNVGVTTAPVTIDVAGIGNGTLDYGFQLVDTDSVVAVPTAGQKYLFRISLKNMVVGEGFGEPFLLHLISPDMSVDKNYILKRDENYGFDYVSQGGDVPPVVPFYVKVVGNDMVGNIFERYSKSAINAIDNPCQVSPCNGHGDCHVVHPTNDSSAAACNCYPGWYGDHCQYMDTTPSSATTTSPAAATTTTTTTTASHTTPVPSETCSGHGTAYCKCDPGYYGDHCENRVDWCTKLSDEVIVDPGVNRSSICGEHGTCVNEVLGAHCDCDDGFSGEFCQHVNPDGPYTLAKKCLVYAPTGGVTPPPDVPVGCASYPNHECVPEDLQCFYRHCPYPVGWCIPVARESYSSLMTMMKRPH